MTVSGGLTPPPATPRREVSSSPQPMWGPANGLGWLGAPAGVMPVGTARRTQYGYGNATGWSPAVRRLCRDTSVANAPLAGSPVTATLLAIRSEAAPK